MLAVWKVPWGSYQATWRSNGVNWSINQYCLYTSFVFSPHDCFLWHHYLQKEVSRKKKKEKSNNANNANTAMCLQVSPFSRTDLFLLLSLSSHSALPGATHRVGLLPSSHTWAHAGLLPPMLLPPMPWESLVILSHGRGSGFSFCGISILHTPVRQIKSSPGIKKSCASWHRDPWPSFSIMKTSGNGNIWGECNRCPWNSEVFPFNYTARNSGAHKVSVFAPLFALLLA